jgi:hypothetical protein
LTLRTKQDSGVCGPSWLRSYLGLKDDDGIQSGT